MAEDKENTTAPRPALDPEQILLPEAINFDCHHSGRCCEDFWEIPLDDASLARLKSLPLSSISPKFLDTEHYTEESASRPGGIGLRRAAGRCVFLNTGRRCLIHHNFGAAAKPQTCIDFPFRYVQTPRGVFVGLSTACPSVRGNLGRPLAEQRDQIAANYSQALAVASIADPIELVSGLPIDFDAYEQIETCLIDLISMETVSIDDRLIAGYVFLQLLERALLEVGQTRELAGANVVQVIDVFRKDEYRRVVAIARKARGTARLHRAVVGMLITYRSAFDARKRGRLGRSSYLIYQYVRHMGGMGTVRMPPLNERQRLSHLRAVRVDWNDPYFVHHIDSFFRHALFRKDLIMRTSLAKGYGFLLVYVALMRWYARAYATARGESEVGRNDFDEAIGAVEKYYCLHTDFMQLFELYPVLTGMVERLMAKPFFAPSIMRSSGP